MIISRDITIVTSNLSLPNALKLLNDSWTVSFKQHIADVDPLGTSPIILLDEIMAIIDLSAYATNRFCLVASTNFTLSQLNLADSHAARFCTWAGFADHSTWELAISNQAVESDFEELLQAFGKQILVIPDVPGFIAPRTIALLVNEAWHVWQDGISSPQDIDTAMQLGTNYPYGPLEWGTTIGEDKIASLLVELSKENKDYYPQAALALNL